MASHQAKTNAEPVQQKAPAPQESLKQCGGASLFEIGWNEGEVGESLEAGASTLSSLDIASIPLGEPTDPKLWPPVQRHADDAPVQMKTTIKLFAERNDEEKVVTGMSIERPTTPADIKDRVKQRQELDNTQGLALRHIKPWSETKGDVTEALTDDMLTVGQGAQIVGDMLQQTVDEVGQDNLPGYVARKGKRIPPVITRESLEEQVEQWVLADSYNATNLFYGDARENRELSDDSWDDPQVADGGGAFDDSPKIDTVRFEIENIRPDLAEYLGVPSAEDIGRFWDAEEPYDGEEVPPFPESSGVDGDAIAVMEEHFMAANVALDYTIPWWANVLRNWGYFKLPKTFRMPGTRELEEEQEEEEEEEV